MSVFRTKEHFYLNVEHAVIFPGKTKNIHKTQVKFDGYQEEIFGKRSDSYLL